MATVPVPKRGEIWLVRFDPSVGAEIRKLRPTMIVSIDAIGRLPLRMVVPVTDWKPAYSAFPWMVHLKADSTNGLAKDSAADAFQTKSVALERMVRRLGEVKPAELNAVAAAIALCVDAP